MGEYKGYTLRESNGSFYPSKPRPYDDADYYYASSLDKVNWVIGYNGKRHASIKGDFRDVVDYLERLNKNIEPIMCHN